MRPHPALVDLAARRPPSTPINVSKIAPSAHEHGMAGLVVSHLARNGAAFIGDPAPLTAVDVATQSANRKQVEVLREVLERMAAADAKVAAFGGVTIEARWYGRTGERPSTGVALLLHPDDAPRMARLVAAIDPTHVAGKPERVATVQLDGVPVSVHADLFTLGPRSRTSRAVWSRVVDIEIPTVGTVTALDAATQLVERLVAANREGFPFLLGHADAVRIAAGDVDWDAIVDLARMQRVETAVRCALVAAYEDLYLPRPAGAPGAAGGRLWRAAWGPARRLRGSPANPRHQGWLAPLLVRRWPSSRNGQ